MKKRVQGVFVGILIYMLVFSGVSLAVNIQKNIEITYRDIKLNVDGEEIVPKSVTGKIVEPFIYDGTTYLPVRAVAEALNRDVDWDNDTSMVIIKEKELREVPFLQVKRISVSGESKYYGGFLDGEYFAGFFPNLSTSISYRDRLMGLSCDSPEVVYELPEGNSYISGTLMPIDYYLKHYLGDDYNKKLDGFEYHVRISVIYDDETSGKAGQKRKSIYSATVEGEDTEPLDFEVFTNDADKLVISYEGSIPSSVCMFAIKNPKVYVYGK